MITVFALCDFCYAMRSMFGGPSSAQGREQESQPFGRARRVQNHVSTVAANYGTSGEETVDPQKSKAAALWSNDIKPQRLRRDVTLPVLKARRICLEHWAGARIFLSRLRLAAKPAAGAAAANAVAAVAEHILPAPQN